MQIEYILSAKAESQKDFFFGGVGQVISQTDNHFEASFIGYKLCNQPATISKDQSSLVV